MNQMQLQAAVDRVGQVIRIHRYKSEDAKLRKNPEGGAWQVGAIVEAMLVLASGGVRGK